MTNENKYTQQNIYVHAMPIPIHKIFTKLNAKKKELIHK